VTHHADADAKYNKPFLILDVRDEEAFEQCHLMDARNFPASNIRHDKMTAEILSYKNRDGHLIVLYDEDERNAAPAATALVQKGFDNIYLLSGGLRKIVDNAPHMVEGDLPVIEDTRSARTYTVHFNHSHSALVLSSH
jgi:centrosomal protein CEP41